MFHARRLAPLKASSSVISMFGSAGRSRARARRRWAPPPPSHHVAEQIVENVGHGGGEAVAAAEAAAHAAGACSKAADGRSDHRPRASAPSERHLIGLVEFLELGLGLLVARIACRGDAASPALRKAAFNSTSVTVRVTPRIS
jgi:hypothetical protein